MFLVPWYHWYLYFFKFPGERFLTFEFFDSVKKSHDLFSLSGIPIYKGTKVKKLL